MVHKIINPYLKYNRNKQNRPLEPVHDKLSFSNLNALICCNAWEDFHVSQPFTVQVQSNVFVMIDFHSHLYSTEVVGLLGGSWDPIKNELVVQEAFPCRSGDDHGSIDVVSELEIRRKIGEKRGLRVVGWYHSHTDYEPDPSCSDILNQTKLQMGSSIKDEEFSPFIGLIGSIYDERIPNDTSVYNMFMVHDGLPVCMNHYVYNEDNVPVSMILKMEFLLVSSLVEPCRTIYAESWKSISKLQKFKDCLTSRLPLRMTQDRRVRLVEHLLGSMT